MKEETWVAVDGHGNEYAFNAEPGRDFPNLDLRVRWGQRWKVGTTVDSARFRNGVKLPKGTIKMLTGRVLTYADDPICIEFEDYGNYEETRLEVLNPAMPEDWK